MIAIFTQVGASGLMGVLVIAVGSYLNVYFGYKMEDVRKQEMK